MKVNWGRRGGAPSGAAAFIVFGGMGASAPIVIQYLRYPFNNEPSFSTLNK